MKILTLVFLTLLSCSAVSGVYKWYDDEGNVYYGDHPPKSVKIQTLTTASISFVGGERKAAKATGKEDVVLYVTQHCPWCAKAKRFLKDKNIPYVAKDVERSKEARQQFRKLGGKGVPLILVGSQKMSGFSSGKLKGLLVQAGYKL